MDTYEKKYNKALKWMRELYPGLHGATKEDAEHYFPELRKSDDERVIEEIKFAIMQMSSGREDTKQRCLAWLEKQKEHSMSAEEVLTRAGLKPYKDGNQWCILAGDNIQEGICGFGDTIEDALYEFLKEVLDFLKEQKPVVTHGETYHVDTLGTQQVIAGKMPQKPAEWSEKDEAMIKSILFVLESYVSHSDSESASSPSLITSYPTYYKEIDWLKSLRPVSKESLQPQQNMSISFMLYLDEHRPDGKMCLSNAECNEIETAFKNQSWDTILRYVEKYQPHWKPSNTQINYLGAAVIEAQRRHNESVNGFPRYHALKELYEQLLKL